MEPAPGLMALNEAGSPQPALSSFATGRQEALSGGAELPLTPDFGVRSQTLGMAPLAARCRLGLGEVDLRLGETEGACEHLAAAAAEFQAIGMAGWLDRARTAFARAG